MTMTNDVTATRVRLSPLNNVVFACLFKDEKAMPAMLGFLNSVLRHVGEEPISEILEMRSEYPVIGETANVKTGRLDVRVKAESGRLFDIEVQVKKEFINPRGFFYGARLGLDAFMSGLSYKELPETRVITLNDFYVRDAGRHLVEPVALTYMNKPVEVATDKFMMYHIQLPVFRKMYPTLASVIGDPLSEWLYMFDRGYKSEKEMEVLSHMSDDLKNFALRYNLAMDDPDLIWKYRMVEDGKRDVISQIQSAEKRGERRGEKRGKKLEKIQTAKNLIKAGIDRSIIAQVVELPLEEVQKLINDIKL